MGYSDKISRSNVIEADQTLVREIIQGISENSQILPLMTKLPNMTGKQAKLPILAALPEAYWVSGDEGLKQTTQAAWKNKFITAEEVAVVVPIAEAVLADSEYDIWSEIKPKIIEAFYKKIDEAIILGKDKPQSFREGLIPSITNAGNVITHSSATLFEEISDAMSKVEQDGFDVTAILGGPKLKGKFRTGLRDTTGQPLQSDEITALTKKYVKNGAWDDAFDMIVGDFSQAVYAMRQDIEFKLFDSGVVTDNTGAIIYNLMQQDMVALRVTLRMGWELPNPINAVNSDEATRFPLAIVQPSAPTTYTVTFTVTDDAVSPAAIQNAVVTFGSQVLKTNASGQAVFKSLGSSSYLYSVEKSGKETVYGKKSVSTSNTTVSVVLKAA